MSLFITGAGTDVGKTLVTSLLLRQLRATGIDASAIKPVLSGFDPAHPAGSDAALLLAAMDLPPTPANLDRIAPWRFAAPLSPDMAAAREGRAIDFDALLTFCRTRLAAAPGPLLIEGVGGAMVPLDDRHLVTDWMAALGLPALLVAGTYVGAISHCLTALAALQARDLPVRAILLSTSVQSPVPAEETAATLARFTDCPIRVVPRLEKDADGLALGPAPDLTDLAM